MGDEGGTTELDLAFAGQVPSHSVAATVMSNPDNEYLMGLATEVRGFFDCHSTRSPRHIRSMRSRWSYASSDLHHISHGQVHRASWPVSRLVDSSHGDLRKRMNFFLISEDLITRSLIIDKTIQATPPDRYRVLMGLQRSCS